MVEWRRALTHSTIMRISMRACARVALVLLAVSAGHGLAGCASIEELKDTMVAWFNTKFPPEREGMLPGDAAEAPHREALKEDASKASKAKANATETPARKLQRPQTAESAKKPASSVPAEATTPQRAVRRQSAPPDAVAGRLHTLWPEAPAPGTFSR
jgi:hypothetical protein